MTAGLAAMALSSTSGYSVAEGVGDDDDSFAPRVVFFDGGYPLGEVHVFPDQFHLYLILSATRAMRYSVGIGKPGLYRAGTFTVGRKAKWPAWRPTKAMIKRDPAAYARFADGMRGGPNNPLGARALYLFTADGRDTYLRIHGTNKPATIGTAVSNGCARLTNDHVTHLYDRVPVGSRVILHEQS
jgi:lipoprotein-anchoring transpeptidase ErfK/SrfK